MEEEENIDNDDTEHKGGFLSINKMGNPTFEGSHTSKGEGTFNEIWKKWQIQEYQERITLL